MAQMNMQQMMKQARKMQEQLAAAQETIAQSTVDASAGGGLVKVTVSLRSRSTRRPSTPRTSRCSRTWLWQP